MLVLRYKTLVGFPGVPAGEIMQKTTASADGYRGRAYPALWVAEQTVETDETKFALDQVITGETGNFLVLWSAAADATIADRQTLKAQLAALTTAINALSVKLG